MKQKIVFLLKGYKHFGTEQKHGLEKLGFIVSYGKKHVKVYYPAKNRKLFVTIPLTPSCDRSGINAAHEIYRKLVA